MTNSNLRRKLSIAELCNLALPDLSDTSHIFNEGHVRVVSLMLCLFNVVVLVVVVLVVVVLVVVVLVVVIVVVFIT